jgi:SAM-dependent methyltransferase
VDPREYEKLYRLDRDHWFYRGKRAIVRHWIGQYLPLKPDDVLIDAGTGTGTWPVEMSQVCRVIGLDDHAESIALARPRIEAVGGQVMQTTLDRVDLPDQTAAVATMLDVLEHLDDDRSALREMIRLVRPGGLIVVTVPALRWLWSDWDVTLHHRRRYHRPDLLGLVSQPEVEVLRCAYINTAALLPILLVRLWRRFFPPRPGAERAEDRVPWGPVDALLYHLFVTPACWGWFRPPAGVSLLAALRVKAEMPSMEKTSSALETVRTPEVPR